MISIQQTPPKGTNFDRSFIKTHVTEELKRKKRQNESFAPKITQNNPEVLSKSIEVTNRQGAKREEYANNSKLYNTMQRRLNENFTLNKKTMVDKNLYMSP